MRLVRLFQLLLISILMIPSGTVQAAGTASVTMSLSIDATRTVTVKLPDIVNTPLIEVDVEGAGALVSLESKDEVVTYEIAANLELSDFSEDAMPRDSITAITIY